MSIGKLAFGLELRRAEYDGPVSRLSSVGVEELLLVAERLQTSPAGNMEAFENTSAAKAD